MLSRGGVLGHSGDRVALKDGRLIYRACSTAFAISVGRRSPDHVIGKTDFDLFSGEVAREQMALDSQIMYSAEADISSICLQGVDGSTGPERVMIVRTPIIAADNKVRGIDIRLLGGPAGQLQQPLDYQMLVNDGIQGSLVLDGNVFLYANDVAAHVLGFPSAQALIDNALVSDLFNDEDLQLVRGAAAPFPSSLAVAGVQRVNLRAVSQTGSLVRLIGRVTVTHWGARRAILLSFVDVAITEQPGSRVDSSLVLPASVLTRQLADLKRIRANEQRYRHYASAAADFFWELDARLTFRVASDGLVRVLGLPRDHIVGRTLDQLLDHPANISEESHWTEHLALLRECQPFRDFEFRWSVDGESRTVRYSGIPVFNIAREFVGYRGVGCDVTASVRQAETMAYHANHDALTGLVNRRSFEHTVHEALCATRLSRRPHALCFLDLDAFKIVNDTCGHQAGDELLRQLTQLFDSLVRKSDVLARLGGDEFGILLYKCDVPEALKLANQIRHEVENFHFLWQENRFNIGVSVGLVVVDDRWDSVQSLFAAADSACYIAKNEGRNRVVVYREGEGNSSNRKVSTHWVEEINTALDTDRLRLASQKIMPLDNNQPEGLRLEMLLRLEMPNGELVVPKAFLPAAERYGLISALDERAIQLTLSWLVANPLMLDTIRHVALNVSAGSITDPAFAGRLIHFIQNSQVPASKLCFEITETAAIANLSKVGAFMNQLAAIGCRFGIDDFGSGLSSFAYLRKLPVDFLKIDGLLIKDILDDRTDFTLVKAISDISKSMGKRTVAEFIESPELLSAARGIGIDFGQGFHISEPELIS